MNNPEILKGYHAHVYYRNDDERAAAAELRETVENNFKVAMGRWRDEPVGPHPLPMYQIAFSTETFNTFLPWLMLNRGDLTILIHPLSGDDVADHRDFPMWMGEALDLNIAFLEAGNTSA